MDVARGNYMKRIKSLVQLRGAGLACVFLGIMVLLPGYKNAFAGWEAGSEVGFDSNINRSINDGQWDMYVAAYGSLVREPSGESRVGWSGAVTLEGVSFVRNDDLNRAMISISPGVTYFLHALWRVDIAPFFEARLVKDSDQSSLAFGGRAALLEQITRDLYAGQYYIYRDNRADAETYSFTEHVVGAFLGVNWTDSFFTELGYEFSCGDSFRTISTTSKIPPDKGRHRIHSDTFGTDVIREEVDQHSIGVSAGIDWADSLSTYIGYTFTTTDGDLGSSASHVGSLGVRYRF